MTDYIFVLLIGSVATPILGGNTVILLNWLKSKK